MGIENEPLIQTMRKDIAYLNSEIERLKIENNPKEKEQKQDLSWAYLLIGVLFFMVLFK